MAELVDALLGKPKAASAKKGVIVIDPGHGGSAMVGGSSPNNATAPSGVLEKNITLSMAFLTRDAILAAAAAEGHTIEVVLTRDEDKNLGLSDRARVSRMRDADVMLSIHCNAFDKSARGVETLIRIKADNPNHEDDRALATTVQQAVLGAIQSFDAATKDRGVKDQKLGVLNDQFLGAKTKACLVELEFIDVPAVDMLLNIGPKSSEVRQSIATALAGALLEHLPEKTA